jgi:hypothetical protein
MLKGIHPVNQRKKLPILGYIPVAKRYSTLSLLCVSSLKNTTSTAKTSGKCHRRGIKRAIPFVPVLLLIDNQCLL